MTGGTATYTDGRPAEYDLYMVRGDTWTQTLVWEPGGTGMDFSGASAKFQIRQYEDDASALLTLSSGGSGITLGSAGTITLEAGTALTAGLTFDRARYDLQITDSGGDVTTILRGDMRLIRDVTR